MLIPAIRLLRPHQWIKNFFVFAVVFFGGVFLDVLPLTQALLAFVLFALVSSSIYALNDLFDLEKDRLHPQKRFRPLASGAVSKSFAWSMVAVLPVVAAGILWSSWQYVTYPLQLAVVLAGYWVLNVLYSLFLKRIAIIDLFVIAIGFVLRIYAGEAACGIRASQWLVLMTLLLSLFLTLGKRRDDVLILQRTGQSMRKNIAGYNLAFVDACIGLLASSLLITYILYTLSPEVADMIGPHNHLYYTVLPVLYGIFRYLQLTLVFEKSGSPTKMLYQDRALQIAVLVWILLFAVIRYLAL